MTSLNGALAPCDRVSICSLAEGMGRRAQVGNDLVPRLVQLADDGDVAQLGDIG